MPTRPPFDIVHLAHTTFPEDPRPRRESVLAAETGARTAIVVLNDGRDRRAVSRYGKVAVVRLKGNRRRGSIGKYLVEYLDFLVRARALFRRDDRFRLARVVHVHTLPDFLVAAALPARRRGARIILDLHEVFPEFTRSKFRGWPGRLAERVARRLERWSRRQADVILTVNDAVAEQLLSRPARPRERVVVIHNFADPGEFGPPRLTTGNLHRPVRLVYHGTITPLYGLDLAVQAIARARQAGVEATLDIYGSGPAADDLTRLVETLGLGSAVRLPGPVPHERLQELLPTYDAGLVPTRLDVMTRFSLSTKLLEYIHLGIPVLVPAIPTYVRYIPRDAAWYFEPESVAGAADRLRDFVRADPAERVERARRAQIAASTRLDPARDAATLKQLYRELLGQPGADGRAGQPR